MKRKTALNHGRARVGSFPHPLRVARHATYWWGGRSCCADDGHAGSKSVSAVKRRNIFGQEYDSSNSIGASLVMRQMLEVVERR